MATNNIKQIKLPNNITYNIELCDDSKKLVLASAALTGTPTAPTAAAGTNTTQIATTAFVNTEINNKIAAADAMIYKGTIGTNGTVTSLPTTHKTGYTYKVITAGNYAGVKCEIGDMIICLIDGTTANNAHWTVVQNNIDGAVIGPASSVDNRIAIFNGTTGKLIEDSGFTIATSVPANAKFTDTTYTFTTGSSNGTFNVTPLGGTAQPVAIKGLGSAAYTASTAYATAAQGTKADNALPKAGGTITGNLGINGKVTQGSPSSDSTVTNMNRFQADLFVEGNGSAPNIPKAAGFYLGKSASDGNRHMDIVSGDTYSYIDFNKAGNNLDYDVRMLIDVNTGYSQFMWDSTKSSKILNVAGTLQQNGVGVATLNDLNTKAPAYTYQTTDPGAGSSLAAGKLLFVYS